MATAAIEEEVQVLQAIYGDEAVRLVAAPPSIDAVARVEVDLQPRVEQGAVLVSVTLAVDLPTGYPKEALPRVTVERSRGLLDGALAKLAGAGEQAASEYGLQEDGCISQIMAEISEALDAANEASECCICLQECPPGAQAVRAGCDHVFHKVCLSHWASLKAKEAEAEACESLSSVRAQRDAFERDLSETVAKQTSAEERAFVLQEKVESLSAIISAAKARELALARHDNPADLDLKDLDEDLQEEPIEAWARRLQQRKGQLQKERETERRLQSRSTELRRKLADVDGELRDKAEGLSAAGLPCPVCRHPIPQNLFSASPSVALTVAAGPGPGSSESSIARLSPALRKQVEKLQKEHAEITRRREEKERRLAEEAAAAAALAAEQLEGNPTADSLLDTAKAVPEKTSTASTSADKPHGKGRRKGGEVGEGQAASPPLESASRKGRGGKGPVGAHPGRPTDNSHHYQSSDKYGKNDWKEWPEWDSSGGWASSDWYGQSWSDHQQKESAVWAAGGRGNRWNRSSK
mmetsp:Transcript_12156/g.28361  ORF Transcript_12156/g.28361 Transcript_12156/m.28361 type:complete len:524 (+) Transcript_12156:75-1646(+)